jgi:transcription elongation factor Elf1
MSKINMYKCPNGHETVTIDTIDRTVTPFQIACPECKASAKSSNYQVSQDLKPTYEWFVPKTIKEYKEACIPIYGDVFNDNEYRAMLEDKEGAMYRKIKSE